MPPLDEDLVARIEALADLDGHRAALTATLDRIGAGERDAVQLRVVGELGYATALGGSGRRSLEGGLDTDGRRVMVTGGPRPER